MKKKAKKPRYEIIWWNDACADNGWKEAPHSYSVMAIISVGYVVRENKKEIILAGSWGKTDSGEVDTNNRMAIPAGFVVKRRRLRLPL